MLSAQRAQVMTLKSDIVVEGQGCVRGGKEMDESFVGSPERHEADEAAQKTQANGEMP